MVTCGDFIEPLNFECLFVNVLAGSKEIFVFLAFIFIAGLAARFRMNNTLTLIILALFGVLMAQFFPALYILIVLLVALFVGRAISKVVKN